MPSHSLALLCLQKGAELLAADDTIRAAAFMSAGACFDRDGEAPRFVAALAKRLSEKTAAALQAGDPAGAQCYDDMLRIFLPTGASQLPEEQASARAQSRVADMQQSYMRNDLPPSAAHFLAAATLSPEDHILPGSRQSIHAALTEARSFNPNGAPTEDTLLSFALGLRIEQRPGTLITVADWCLRADDFRTALEFAQKAAQAPDTTQEQIQATFIAECARHRLNGLDALEAERQADEVTARALRSLGPPEELTTDLLVMRSERTYLKPGISSALNDLRVILARESAPIKDRNYAASLVLCCLRNALHPENQTALEIMEANAADSAESILPLFYSAWTSGAMGSALRLAKRLTQWYPAFAIMPALHEMATDHDLVPAAVIGKARPAEYRIYATVACWGVPYISLMEVSMLASLLAPNNFPALAEKAELHLELFTMQEDVQRLANSPALRKLGDHCVVKIFAFPDEVSFHRGELPFMLLGFASHATALRAERDGADLMHISADMIFADGSYAAVAKRLTHEPLLLLNDNLNAYSEPVLKRLEPCFDGVALTVSSSQLLDAASGALSRRSVDQIYRPNDGETPYYPVKTIFQLPHGLAMHSFYANTVYVSHAGLAPILMKNFAPLDGVFFEHLLQNVKRGRLEMLVANEFLGLEVCKDDGDVFEVRPQALLKSIKDVFFSTGIPVIRKVLFPHRNFFAGVAVDVAREVDEAQAERVVRSVMDFFETDPVLSDLQKESEPIERLYRQAWAQAGAQEKTALRSY